MALAGRTRGRSGAGLEAASETSSATSKGERGRALPPSARGGRHLADSEDALRNSTLARFDGDAGGDDGDEARVAARGRDEPGSGGSPARHLPDDDHVAAVSAAPGCATTTATDAAPRRQARHPGDAGGRPASHREPRSASSATGSAMPTSSTTTTTTTTTPRSGIEPAASLSSSEACGARDGTVAQRGRRRGRARGCARLRARAEPGRLAGLAGRDTAERPRDVPSCPGAARLDARLRRAPSILC